MDRIHFRITNPEVYQRCCRYGKPFFSGGDAFLLKADLDEAILAVRFLTVESQSQLDAQQMEGITIRYNNDNFFLPNVRGTLPIIQKYSRTPMSVVTNRQAYYVRIIVLLFSDLYNYIHDAAKTENNKSTATASYIFAGLIPRAISVYK